MSSHCRLNGFAGRAMAPLVLASLLLSAFSPAYQQPRKYWIWFTDKGPEPAAKSSGAYRAAEANLDSRARGRRARNGAQSVDAADLPVYPRYLQALSAAGVHPVRVSRWLNSVSAFLTPAQTDAIRRIPGVSGVSPVVVHHGSRRNIAGPGSVQQFFDAASSNRYEYGPSRQQDSTVDVIQLHDAGITGGGVLIGMLDSGFRWRAHNALSTRDVIAEHDFVNNDDDVANDASDPLIEDHHGTLTFSIIGGFYPGRLIGVAHNAGFVLGKTEYDYGDDYYWEEDNWVAGIEWMEGLGVDIVSCSLGYGDFQDTTSYSWGNGDFNGRTTVTARAAIRAARLGVLLCTAMGNAHNGDGVTGTMLTPADADSIISVGAVFFDHHIAPFSSTGPTNDGRIKPDLVAPGSSVYGAYYTAPDSFKTDVGTSVATPLTAGCAALLLSARPELTAQQIIATLRATARHDIDDSRSAVYPNNFAGWGSVDGFAAALSFGPVFSNRPVMRSSGRFNDVSTVILSKFGLLNEDVRFYYAFNADTHFVSVPMFLDSAMVFETSGRYRVNIPSAANGTLVRFYIEARDSAGNMYRSPAAAPASEWALVYGYTAVQEQRLPSREYRLGVNYPNPFNPSTVIPFITPAPALVDLKIYNTLGQQVRSLFSGLSAAGENTARWDGNNDDGLPAPSGVYFCRLAVRGETSTSRIVLVR